MALLPVAKFATTLDPPVTRQWVYKLVEKGDLVITAKKIDTEHPVNKAWIRGHPHSTNPKPPVTGRKMAVADDGSRYVPPVQQQADDGGEAEALLEQVGTLDLNTMTKAQIDKIRVLETALKTRVERQQRRRELIDRSLVQTAFGRLWQIDSNSWRPLGAALAPEIAGMLGTDDPEKVLEVEKVIDEKVSKVLAHVRRTMQEALTAWGAVGGVL